MRTNGHLAGWRSGQKRSLGSLNLRFFFLTAESPADSWLLRMLYWETWKRQRNHQWNSLSCEHAPTIPLRESRWSEVTHLQSSHAFFHFRTRIWRGRFVFLFAGSASRHKSGGESLPNSLRGYVTHLHQQITQFLTGLSFTAFAGLVFTFASCPNDKIYVYKGPGDKFIKMFLIKTSFYDH